MKLARLSPWTRPALAFLLAGSIAACGGDDITFGGGDDDDDDETETVTLTGNIDDVFPIGGRDIVVFAYNVDEDAYTCPCPTNPADPDDPSYSTRGKAQVLESGETEFSIAGLDSGPIAVVFLLDNAGDLADGEIDPGDDIAILDDVDCELDDGVEANTTVTLEDVDIFFDPDPLLDTPLMSDRCQETDDPPGQGRARANEITAERKTGSE